MIVNLVGPPAAGKSTFAARFVLEHPEFKYCSIDGYRAFHQNEDKAWEHMEQDLEQANNVILESCGLNWRLRNVLNNEQIRTNPLVTINFFGDQRIIKERLNNRQKREYPHTHHHTEIESVDYVLANVHEQSVAPIDMSIIVTDKTPSEVYEAVTEFIAHKMIENFGKDNRREQDFTKGI